MMFIRLANDDDGRDIVGNYGWSGEWPPPEKLWRMVGKTTGFESLTTEPIPENVREEVNEVATVTVFERKSYSQITDENAADMTHVARGALYVPVAG